MNRRFSLYALLLSAVFSCAKQEVPQPQVQESLSFGVSLPDNDARTALGPQEAGKYPTLWQEGDRISLNGFPSLALSAEKAGSKSASFIFRGGLSSPFNLLYPAGGPCDTVTFLAAQKYVAGSFDPQAAPMWASTAEYQDVTLKHLSSLLRFDIKGSATLSQIAITSVGQEPLSGNYAMKKNSAGLYTGEITPVKTSSSVVLSFGESGLALNPSQATPIHVAIPAGTYEKGFKAILKASDGTLMVISFFTAQGRTIAPSKLLHFDEFEFKAGGDDVLYIFTAEDLASLRGSKASKAYLMNDLNISASGWESIENWSGSFDGMGHSILGNSSAPLFASSEAKSSLSVTSLSIEGLPVLNQSEGKTSIKDCVFGKMSEKPVALTGGSLTIEDSSFEGNNLNAGSARCISVSGGNLTLNRTSFTDNGTVASTGAAIYLGTCTDSNIRIDGCRFVGNKGNGGSGSAIHGLATFSGTIFINGTIFYANVNKQFGCIHFAAPGADNGGFIGISNCLFYDNYGTASTSSKSVDTADLNPSVRHIVVNTSFVSTKEHLCGMNIRCGSMSAYSGGAKGSLFVNNIFVNENKSGYNFSAAAANKYYLNFAGYNRYDIGANATYGGVTLSTLDKNVSTEGSFDAKALLWSWNPTSEDKAVMLEGSASDVKKYLKDHADAEYLSAYAVLFTNWLDSLGALSKDLYGNPRKSAKYWPGCYQGE